MLDDGPQAGPTFVTLRTDLRSNRAFVFGYEKTREIARPGLFMRLELRPMFQLEVDPGSAPAVVVQTPARQKKFRILRVVVLVRRHIRHFFELIVSFHGTLRCLD